MSEYRRADAHMGRAELDRGREIGAHAHRQILQPVARGDLCGQCEVRRRRIVDRRNAHQAGNRQAVFFAAAGYEGIRLGWGDARQRLEVDTYLTTARREYSVPPPGPPGPPPDEASTTMD